MSVDNKGFEIKESKGTEVCVCCFRNDDQGSTPLKQLGAEARMQ